MEVEDVTTHLVNCQARFIARYVEDPTELGGIMPVGFGEVLGTTSWWRKEMAGHGMTMARSVSEERGRMAGSCPCWPAWLAFCHLPEGKPLWGGLCRKVDIEEVDIRPAGRQGDQGDPEDPEAWEKEISKTGEGGA